MKDFNHTDFIFNRDSQFAKFSRLWFFSPIWDRKTFWNLKTNVQVGKTVSCPALLCSHVLDPGREANVQKGQISAPSVPTVPTDYLTSCQLWCKKVFAAHATYNLKYCLPDCPQIPSAAPLITCLFISYRLQSESTSYQKPCTWKIGQ